MPRHPLNPRFHAYIARSRRMRKAATLATITLLVSSASAFILTTDAHALAVVSEHVASARASLTSNIGSARDGATSFLQANFAFTREKFPDAIAAVGNIPSQAHTQLAAAATPSDIFGQWVGNILFRTFCPLFGTCPQEQPIEIPPTGPGPQLTQSDHATNSINVKPTASNQPAGLPPQGGTATNVAVSQKNFPSSPATSQQAAATPPQQTTNQPVIERIRETVRIEPGVNVSYVDVRLSLLENSILTRMDTQIDGIVRSFRNGTGGGGGSGSVTSVDASGGVTGLTFSGGPITSSGTLTLSGTLAETSGGTGLSTAPSYGQLLVGNASSGYDLAATSSLGLPTFADVTSSIGAVSFGKSWEMFSGAYLAPTTTLGILVSASSTIGNGTQTGGLTISGGATTTGNVYFAGKVGIGVTNPTSRLDLLSSTGALNGIYMQFLRGSDNAVLGSIIEGQGDTAAQFKGAFSDINGTDFDMNNSRLLMNSSYNLFWTSGTVQQSIDVGLTRDTVGVLRVNNGSTGVGSLRVATTTFEVAPLVRTVFPLR